MRILLVDDEPALRELLRATFEGADVTVDEAESDRKSTRLNSSHVAISYAVFCLKKKNITDVCVPIDGFFVDGCGDGGVRSPFFVLGLDVLQKPDNLIVDVFVSYYLAVSGPEGWV